MFYTISDQSSAGVQGETALSWVTSVKPWENTAVSESKKPEVSFLNCEYSAVKLSVQCSFELWRTTRKNRMCRWLHWWSGYQRRLHRWLPRSVASCANVSFSTNRSKILFENNQMATRRHRETDFYQVSFLNCEYAAVKLSVQCSFELWIARGGQRKLFKVAGKRRRDENICNERRIFRTRNR